MSECSNVLRAQGLSYPRTCRRCGLGPCNNALGKAAEAAVESLKTEAALASPRPTEKVTQLSVVSSHDAVRAERRAQLLRMLDQAREAVERDFAGGLRDLAIVGSYADGQTFTSASELDDVQRMLGALQIMGYRLLTGKVQL